MARKVWWCDNCGYETYSRGRCPGCGERLLPSALPELEVGNTDEEVGYGLAGWDGTARGRLIEALLDANVSHRFEDDELVVRVTDEAKVDALASEVMARKIWWCRNCGFEFTSSGRCQNCRDELVASPLPQLAPADDEVSFTVGDWDSAMRVRLVEALIGAKIVHRFEEEGDELVVRAEDGPSATRITADVVREANEERPVRKYKDLSLEGFSIDTSESRPEDGPPKPRGGGLRDRWGSWRYEHLTRASEHSSTPGDRSVGAAVVLALIFGPLGLWYLAGRYALVGTLAGVLLVNAAQANNWAGAWPGALFLYWAGCAIFAAVKASRRHSEFEAWAAGRDLNRGARK